MNWIQKPRRHDAMGAMCSRSGCLSALLDADNQFEGEEMRGSGRINPPPNPVPNPKLDVRDRKAAAKVPNMHTHGDCYGFQPRRPPRNPVPNPKADVKGSEAIPGSGQTRATAANQQSVTSVPGTKPDSR